MSGTSALLGLLLLAGAAHTWAVLRVRAAGGRWRSRRVVAWWVGTALAGFALAPPVQAWAHHDVRGHMVVHLALGMYAGVGFALAAPVSLALAALRPAHRRRAHALVTSPPARVLAHPVVAAGLDVGGLWLLYTTPLLDRAASRAAVHTLVHVHLLLAGALFAWSVAGPEHGRRRARVRIGVLVGAGAAHAVLAKRLALDVGWAGAQGAEHAVAAAQLMYYGGDVAELVLALLVVRALWLAPRKVVPASPVAAASA